MRPDYHPPDKIDCNLSYQPGMDRSNVETFGDTDLSQHPGMEYREFWRQAPPPPCLQLIVCDTTHVMGAVELGLQILTFCQFSTFGSGRQTSCIDSWLIWTLDCERSQRILCGGSARRSGQNQNKVINLVHFCPAPPPYFSSRWIDRSLSIGTAVTANPSLGTDYYRSYNQSKARHSPPPAAI